MSMSILLGKASLFFARNAATIWTGLGIGAMGAGAVIGATKSLRYHEEVSEPALTKIAELEAEGADPKTINREKYMLLLTTARRYALPIGLFAGGVCCVFIGHGYALKQIAGLSSALAIAQEDNARLSALVDEVSESEDLEGVKESIDNALTERKVESRSILPDEDIFNWSFSESNPNFDPSETVNVNFLEMVERLMNDKLAARGHVFLNEVYDALGMQRTRYGAVMGWASDGDPIEFDPELRREPNGDIWWELNFNPTTNLIAG